MLYPREVIQHLNAWIGGNTNSRHWLEEHRYEELVQLKDAVSRHSKPFEYLLTHKHIVLAAFVNAVWDDKDAFRLLMEKKEFHWAAMANYINGDEGALVFLRRNKLDHYAELAYLIQAKIRREGDEGTSIFSSGPFKIDKD